MWLRSQITWVLIIAPLLGSCTALGSLLSSHLTDEDFSHPYKGRVDGTYFSGLP